MQEQEHHEPIHSLEKGPLHSYMQGQEQDRSSYTQDTDQPHKHSFMQGQERDRFSYTQDPDQPHKHSFMQGMTHSRTCLHQQVDQTYMRTLITDDAMQRKPNTPASNYTWKTRMPSSCSFSNNAASPSKLHSTSSSSSWRTTTNLRPCRRQTWSTKPTVFAPRGNGWQTRT
jgi:hypothetical protein